MGLVYADMFLSEVNGLLPWVPLDLLVVPGAILLWQRFAWRGRAIALLLAAQVGTFVTAAVSYEGQGKALPGRFTLEMAPFFALCVAAVVAALLPRVLVVDGVRAWWRGVRSDTRAMGAGATHWRRLARGAVLVGVGALLLVTLWFAAVGRGAPALLYPGPQGSPMVAREPGALPSWWFGLFPKLPG